MNLILADGTVKNLDLQSDGGQGTVLRCPWLFGISWYLDFLHRSHVSHGNGDGWFLLDDEQHSATRKLLRLGRELSLEQEKSGDRKFFGGIYMMNVPSEGFVPPAFGWPLGVLMRRLHKWLTSL